MTVLPWLTLDALQAGALLALAAIFGADALHRRDRMMGWLALSCLLVSTRHGVGVLDLARVISPDSGDRLQSALGTLGFIALARALALIFPRYYPSHFLPCFFAIAVPNMVRCTLLPLEGWPAKALHLVTLAGYLWACGVTVWVLFRAYRQRDPYGMRLLAGLLGTMIPVLVEIVARLGFGVSIRVSGVSIMLMAITVGVSWVWVQTLDLHARMDSLEAENLAWRGLLPGVSWRSGEDNPLMEDLFGGDWADRLTEPAQGRDGRAYRVRRSPLPSGEQIGWLEVVQEGVHPGDAFLRGWIVGLGMDTPEETERVGAWLQAWGAQVQPWGTVPPREGPYPSILVWAREPSILSVWREYDLARRRCRWVQVGGHRVDGPHARLDAPLAPEALRKTLQRLLVLQP